MTFSRIAVAILFVVVGAALSSLLLLEHHGLRGAVEAVDALCGEGDASGCELVSQSRYSAVGGVSLAAVGLAFYLSLVFLLSLGLVTSEEIARGARTLAVTLLGLALATDVVLLGLQAFAIGAFCKLCLATYVINSGAFFALLPGGFNLATVNKAFTGEGKRAFLAWSVGTVLVFVAIGSVERTLAAASEAQQATLLGATPPQAEAPASPAPAPEPSDPDPEPDATNPPAAAAAAESPPGTEAAEARAELQELRNQLTAALAQNESLQMTLDDPQRYAEYQAAQAAQAFEQEKQQQLALESTPFKGPDSAPIQVVEYSDFLCPYCRNLAGALSNYMPQSGGKVAIFFKHYPLDQDCNPGLSRTLHEGACELALGGVCATEQNRFWPYHDRVFTESPVNAKEADIVRIAVAAGLDGDAMTACLASQSAKDKLSADIQEAKRLQVNSTPTIYVNGRKLAQLNGFLKAIESESKRLGLDGQ